MNFIKGSGSVFLLGGCTSVDLFSYLLDIFLKRVDWLSKRRKKTWRPLCTIGLVFTYVISLLRRYYEGWSWKDRTISRYLERLLLLVLKDIAQAIHSTNTGQCFSKLFFSWKITIQDISELWTNSKQTNKFTDVSKLILLNFLVIQSQISCPDSRSVLKRCFCSYFVKYIPK